MTHDLYKSEYFTLHTRYIVITFEEKSFKVIADNYDTLARIFGFHSFKGKKINYYIINEPLRFQCTYGKYMLYYIGSCNAIIKTNNFDKIIAYLDKYHKDMRIVISQKCVNEQ